jgi:protein-tyrosine phosphatase
MNGQQLVSFALQVAAVALPGVIPAFAQEPSPGASLGIASVPNLRDVGGYSTRDGMVVRRGLAFRSNQLNPISPDDMTKIAALGLKEDFDMRTKAERDKLPDELPPGVENIWLDVLADRTGAGPAQVEQFLADPKKANAALGGGKGEHLFSQAYREFITLRSANAAFRELFLKLGAQEGPSQISLFHCTTGKDRTGWAAAALLTLLGVPQDVVYQDFLRSNDYILPAYKGFIDRFVEGGGDPSIMRDILGVRAEYLKASFGEVNTKYGSIEGYFEKGLGIDQAGQQRLRKRFLTGE